MTAAAAPSSWLAGPIAQELLRFDQLPSQWLHPSRANVPSQLAGVASLHRHWSALLRREHALEAVRDPADPLLPIALLPPERFARLVLFAGVALLAGGLRRTIAREPLAQLAQQLGADGLQFARAEAPRLALPPVEERIDPGAARAQCERWGAALVAIALESASPGVARRAWLRLPADIEDERERLAKAGLEAARALDAARELLQKLEPAWLSSFPAAR
jgi:type III secretion protein K